MPVLVICFMFDDGSPTAAYIITLGQTNDSGLDRPYQLTREADIHAIVPQFTGCDRRLSTTSFADRNIYPTCKLIRSIPEALTVTNQNELRHDTSCNW